MTDRRAVWIIHHQHNLPGRLMSAQRSSQELHALLDAAVDGIVVIDHAGLIESFNRAAERLFGYTTQEVLGRNISLLMPEEDARQHDGHLKRYLDTGVAHIIGKGRDVTAKRRDASTFPAHLAVGVVGGSRPQRFVGFIRDISQQKQTDDEARRLQDRMMHVSRLATVGEMASGIAHELNQPLAAIATYAHACDRLLGVPAPDIEEVQIALRQIAEQAVRAGDIIRRLRSIARGEDSVRAPADINEVISELTGLIRSDAKAHGCQYRCELWAGLPGANVDRAQIQQVVLNLVRNSLEALAMGRIEMPEVVLRTRPTADTDIEISVCDNGPGVDGSVEARIFDPFCTTKPAGTGLGLPISRTIVQTHGGVLNFAPNVPRGACFTIKLPSIGPKPT